MWIAKNGQMISDKAKEAFDLMWEVYTMCDQDDTKFREFLMNDYKWTFEQVEEILPRIKHISEYL